MSTLRTLRFIVGLIWGVIFVWGLVAPFRGQWLSLIIAVLAWFVCGVVFTYLHNSLQRSELMCVRELIQRTELSIALDDWSGALRNSSQAIRILARSHRRDSGENMAPVLATTLIYHGLLLGANGRFNEARVAIDRAASTVLHLTQANPSDTATYMFAQYAREADQLFSSPVWPPTIDFFRERLRALHEPLS